MPEGNGEKSTNNEQLVNATKEELEYYRVVRMTLHGLDGVRLNASIAGITVCSLFLGVAFTAWKYADPIELFGLTFDTGLWIALFSCLLAAVAALQFILKVRMFSGFIISCVEIAKRFETKLVPKDENRLTIQFEKHAFAGARGDNLFQVSLTLILVISAIGFVVSLLNLAQRFWC